MRADEMMKQEAIADKRLIFRDFVTEHRKKIYHLAYDLTGTATDAEDLSQEVFLKAYKALDTFREDSSMYTWLYRITVTTFIDHRRKKSSQAQKYTEELDESRMGQGYGNENTVSLLDDPERTYRRQAAVERIEAALGNLSERERSVFMLKYKNDLCIDEIASLMDIAPGSVKSFLFRATQKLRGALGVGNPSGPGKKENHHG